MRKEGENGSSGTRNTPEDFTPTISRNVLLQHLLSACPKAVIIHCSCWFLFNKPKSTRYLPCYFCAYLTSVKIHKQVIQQSRMTLMRTPSFQQVYYCLHIWIIFLIEPSTPITDSPEDLLSGQCNLIDTGIYVAMIREIILLVILHRWWRCYRVGSSFAAFSIVWSRCYRQCLTRSVYCHFQKY